MKSTTFALGLLASVASAAVPHHHAGHLAHHYRQALNATTYPVIEPPAATSATDAATGGASTTVTVGVTEVHTITSCAPTVTNCPIKGNNGTAVVTEVVAITTVVCPVSEVPAVSSSVISDYSNGVVTGVTSTVEPTGSNPPVAYPTAPAPPGAVVTPSTSVHDQTLTMTVGPSSSRSVVVTTIRSTYTEMVTIKVPGAGNGGGAPPVDDKTTTTTMTSTGTRTVTVNPSSTTTEVSPGGGEASGGIPYPTAPVEGSSSGNGGGNGGGNGESCVAVTVTVTHSIAPQTVYVTVAPSATTDKNSPVPTAPTAVEVPVEDNEDDYEEGDDEATDECPTGTATEDVTASTAATAVPYPTGPAGNGTLPIIPTGGVSYTSPTNSYPTIAVKPRDAFRRRN
ncbi:hypothetical protein MN608_01533 [Microdochium nivale]|nr:hypothetical protein MN608_01533 [Microdochium nivale]